MKNIFVKKQLPYLIFNSICGIFEFYFILRLYGVFEKSLFVKDFSYSNKADYIYFILILGCLIILGNILMYLLSQKKDS